MRRPSLPLTITAVLVLSLGAAKKPTDSADGKDGKDGKSAKKDWNVEAPPGNWRTISIDTDETTWSSVDVSPDGRTIVFDALGDLWTVPLAGGDAKRIT